MHRGETHNLHSSHTKTNYDDQITEMDWGCSMHRYNDKCAQFWLDILKGVDHSEDLGVEGRIISNGS